MEIYKLSDEIEKSTGVRRDDGTDEKKSEQVVTDLKQGVRNPERVNVYIDEKFAFSLDIAQVVSCKKSPLLHATVMLILRNTRASHLVWVSSASRCSSTTSMICACSTKTMSAS